MSRHRGMPAGRLLVAGLAIVAGALPAAGQVVGDPFLPEAPRVPGVTLPLLAPRPAAAWNPLGLPGLGTTPPPLRVSVPGAPARVGALPAGPNPSDIILIPALFSDSPDPNVPAAELRRVLFEGPAEGGTFVDFYHEASRGLANPSGVVAEWVRTDVTMLEAAGSENGHGWIGPRRIDYVIDAIQAVDDDVDFRLFDNDGPDGIPDSGDDDGYIDGLVIEFLGVSGSCGGPAIWPHFGGLGNHDGGPGWPTDDTGISGQPIRARTYLTQSVTRCNGVDVQGPNVIAHEYGHLLGLPDVYEAIDGIEPEKRHWNIGCFGLMGAGSWGCGTDFKDEEFGPVHHSVLMKNQLGWMEIDGVGQVREATFWLEPAQTTGRGLAISLGGGETILLEYRPRMGFDHHLPVGGVLVYHHDTDHTNRNVPAGLPLAKRYHLIEADGDHALRKVQALGGNRGVAEDVFGVDGRTGPYSSLAAGPVRLLSHEGHPLPVTLHEVAVEEGGARARVVLSTHRDPAVMASETTTGLRILDDGVLATLRVAGGALPYEVTSTSPDLELSPEVDGNTVRLVGKPLAAGSVALKAQLADALGRTLQIELSLVVGDLSFELDELVDAAVLAGGGADATAREYLDARGNRNGEPDVGDLRAVLRDWGGGE